MSHEEQVRWVAGTGRGMCGLGVGGRDSVGTRWPEISSLAVRTPRLRLGVGRNRKEITYSITLHPYSSPEREVLAPFY